MNYKGSKLRMYLTGLVLAAVIGAGVVAGCRGGRGGGQASGGATATQESSEGGGGEHGSGGESGGEGGGESGGESGASGSEEGSGATLAPDETFDAVRYGARLIMRYDAANNSFMGSVENTTSGVLTRVRVEVHLSNGTELGPTAEVDLAAGEVLAINLPATAAPFTGWIAHAEVGGGGEGSQSGGEGGGEHGGSGEGSGEHGSGGEGSGGG